MPFNMNPSMTKYRKLLYRDNSAQDWLLSWGFDSTHKSFNAVLSSSSQNGAQLFLRLPPSMLFWVKRLLPVDKQIELII